MSGVLSASARSEDAELSLLITEFEALRAEILDNFATARTLIGLYLLSLGAIGGLAVSGRVSPTILVIVPPLSAVFWWVHLDTRMWVSLAGHYLRSNLVPRARKLGSADSFAWEERLRAMGSPVRFRNLGYLPLRLSAGLDGSCWPIYLLPSLLAALLTAEGSRSSIDLFTDNAGVTYHYPVWLWWSGLGLQLLLIARAFATELMWWRAPDTTRHERSTQRSRKQRRQG